MLRPEDMRLVTIYSLDSERESVLKNLQKAKIVQLKELELSGSSKHEENILNTLRRSAPTEKIKEVSDALLRVSHLVHICKLAKVKLPFVQEMFGLEILGKKKVAPKTTDQVLKEAQKTLKELESQLLSLEEAYTDNTERLQQYRELLETVLKLESEGIDVLAIQKLKATSVVTGIVPTQNISKMSSEIETQTDGYGFIISKEHSKKESIFLTATLSENSSKIHFILKKYGAEIFAFPQLPDVKNLTKWLRTKITTTEKAIKEALSEIKKQRQKHFETLVVLREELEVVKHRLDATHKMLSGQKFFVLQGWVPKGKIIELSKVLYEATRGYVVIEYERPSQNDEPPVKLTNPKWLKPFEMLTELYALPKYGDLDPTFIVGPVFLVFAGFMLTDFVYGLGLVILGLAMLLYFSKYSPGLKNAAISITGIGAFSVIFGVLTGSYLGDAMSYFIGKSSSELALWKDPLADPLYFLIVSIIVALIHLNIGLFLGLIEDIRKKDYKTMVSERIVWWLIQLSVALMYFKISPTLGKVIFGITLIIILALSGPLGILGVTGFMGDVISYSRLFALALSTAGIAMTVNLLADLLYDIPYLGIIFAALIFIGGHLFSFAMNALGAFVHSIRLQFVEFFGKFYEGGGDKFQPFAEERYYTEVEE
ncbi:V-type ATP synthase subunit I [Candidatus Woesearchaeota archaeon]|nr:MAG: V-type ATP synthase subunit I [Candidatus Woesearchaeota archaeon]